MGGMPVFLGNFVVWGKIPVVPVIVIRNITNVYIKQYTYAYDIYFVSATDS